MNLEKPGYYITEFTGNILLFYGDSMETYTERIQEYERTLLSKSVINSINNVFEFEFIGELWKSF